MIPDWILQLPLKTIKSKASEFDIDPLLLASICYVESNGFVYATRYEPHYKWTYQIEKFAKMQGITVQTEENLQKQSYGLCQIMGGTARWLGFTASLPALFKPEPNLYWGCRYLRHLRNKYGKLEDTIAAYNAGSVRKKNEIYINEAYVDKVMNRYREVTKWA